jgi:Uma2 family endonuclease
MSMHVILPEETLPATLKLNPDLRMNDDAYYEFCMANADLRLERTAQGEIVIVPPAGYESDYRNTRILGQLDSWAKRDGRGKACGPSAAFLLPTGAALSPDAAWVSNHRIAQLSKVERRKFPPLCPEFVIEVISPSDRLKSAKEKMAEWMRAGVDLGWLIDGDEQTVYVYRADQKEAEKRTGIIKLAGEGPVAEFELDLTDIWAGL